MTSRSTMGWIGNGLCVLALGCGGGQPAARSTLPSGAPFKPAPASPVNARGSHEVIATVGPAGGTLELSSGPRVEIPPGALGGGVELVLKEAPLTTVFSNDEAEKAAGPTFLLSPSIVSEGPTFKVSIPMARLPDGFGEPTLQYEYEKGARVGAEDAVHTGWDVLPARMANGRMVAESDALPGLRLQFTVTDQEVQ